ncbi:hypothetical protein HYR99_30375 [Candidatus Poribacteria bacterium]|nr:hypothetical protein [Candidatus Poribacteria bacterium]
MNLTVELTTEQVIHLIQQMPPEDKRTVLLALADTARASREARLNYAEEQFRQLCAQRGLDWDAMTEEQREMFVDDLIHEERPCAR